MKSDRTVVLEARKANQYSAMQRVRRATPLDGFLQIAGQKQGSDLLKWYRPLFVTRQISTYAIITAIS